MKSQGIFTFFSAWAYSLEQIAIAAFMNRQNQPQYFCAVFSISAVHSQISMESSQSDFNSLASTYIHVSLKQC